MSKTITTVRTHPDGTLHQIMPNGTERELPPPAPMPAMTDAEIHAAALADPDAQPLTAGSLDLLRLIPRVKTLRRALGLTQEEFATNFQIPLGTLRDWEQGRAHPDQTARAYLKAIAGDAQAVQCALNAAEQRPGQLHVS